VDTVFNSMKEKRATNALELVSEEYEDAEDHLVLVHDSLSTLSNQISENIRTSGDATNNLIRAFAEHGVSYMSMMHQMRNEVGMVINLRYRLNEAEMEAQQNLPHKFVVEKAIPPEKKAYPNKSLIVIVSTFSSLLFALIVLIIIDNIQARLAATREEE